MKQQVQKRAAEAILPLFFSLIFVNSKIINHLCMILKFRGAKTDNQ